MWSMFMGSLIFFVFSFVLLPKLSVNMLVLLMGATLISLFKGLSFSWWFGLMFFLIYVGAILILIYYMFSLSSNINLKMKFSFYYYFIILVIKCYLIYLTDLNSEKSGSYFKFKESLLSSYDFLFLVCAVILFMALWMSNKLQMFKNLALRVFF